MSRADAGRIIHLAKRRERDKEDIEAQRQKLEGERRALATAITTKFTTNVDTTEEQLKAKTVGLLTLEEIKEKHNEVLQKSEKNDIIFEEKPERKREPSEEKKTVQKRILSFNYNDEEEDEEPVVIKKRLGMDPTVDTSFLPDHEREQELIKQKETLAAEWRQLQEKEKNEDINIAYCYWDGSSHRKDMKIKKGAIISQFLQRALEVLRKEFSELKTANTEMLMFVKEDLIIPHFYTFQDFIATKAMEIRVRQDAALDVGESHPVKVVLRNWYEKNKHIYPASRWEPFVPNKEYKRTIDDLSTI
ncbi:XAP5, circadian clock regulator domain-containing protein [Ditylenchus destructor]|uniref:Protein FAM50 homolog n=1 Tax=Ditylenchus destructor TaxID=166010 RepID=A0AAD4RA09_9BILA|nr:XAP5, circadian clock regulator domain-containing protein [Ditylenchus destructor]